MKNILDLTAMELGRRIKKREIGVADKTTMNYL